MNRVYLQINDPHVSDQPPRSRTSSYLDDVLAKLAWCVARANELGASGIVITGDLFHRKNAAHTTHRTVQRVREVLDNALCRVYVVPGNHDEAHGGGLTGQPLLSVFNANIRPLHGPSAYDVYLGGIPWDNAFEREGGAALFAERAMDLGTPLVFAHAPISDKPFPFGPEALGWMLNADVMEAMIERDIETRRFRPYLIAHGHMHGQQAASPHAIIATDISVWFSNPGALSRATVAADDIERAPSIAVIEVAAGPHGIEDVKVRYEEVPHRPAAEVLRIDEHARDGERDDRVESLARELLHSYAEVVDEQALHEMLRTLTRPEGIAEETWTRGLATAGAAIDGEVLA